MRRTTRLLQFSGKITQRYMDMPPEVLVATCIEQGTVYHYEAEFTNHDGSMYRGNRFFIVLNVDPKTDEVIVLTTITKQVTRVETYIARVGEAPETAVRLLPADFSELREESIVNCNSVHSSTREKIVEKLKGEGAVVFFEKIPKTILEHIIAGVMKSNQVPPEFKKLIV